MNSSLRTAAALARCMLFALLAAPGLLPAQDRDRQANDLDALVAQALVVNPSLRAARAQAEAARARIAPAGALPDPMFGIGITNFPVSEPGFGEAMTMKMVALRQTVPFPGKLALAERGAELELQAAQARALAVELEISAEVRQAYYDLALLDRTFEVLESTQQVLVQFIEVNESRYAVGAGGQQDILKAQVEASRLAEDAVTVREERRAALARINALLDRPSDTPVAAPGIPERIARAAVPDNAARIRFTSAVLGARAADSPFPDVRQMQELAIAHSPVLRAHEAEIAAHAALVELADRAHLPDLDVSLDYGQRNDRGDMISVMVSIPVPLHRKKRQDQQAAAARAELAAMQAGHHTMVNRLRADVATLHATLERERARLALFVKAIIPQGRAALEAATSAFQVGRADFLTLLEHHTTLYNYETEYFRALAEFAKQVAELERTVGRELLP